MLSVYPLGGVWLNLLSNVSCTFLPCRDAICRDDLYECGGKGSPQWGSPACEAGPHRVTYNPCCFWYLLVSYNGINTMLQKVEESSKIKPGISSLSPHIF